MKYQKLRGKKSGCQSGLNGSQEYPEYKKNKMFVLLWCVYVRMCVLLLILHLLGANHFVYYCTFASPIQYGPA